jgi:cytochrome c oxidase assembly protein subunit 11
MSNQIQDRFIKNILYIVIGIALITFILIQPYNIFCRIKNVCQPITLSSFSLQKNGQRKITFNFVANIPEDLKGVVEFEPQDKSLSVLNGKNVSSFYRVKNLTKNNLVVGAHFDVDPSNVEKYLEKIECICFKEQPLSANEEVLMPIRFRIHHRIEKDPELYNLEAISVSYSIHLKE